ncbi:MAG TPA: hypothetical protein VE046_13300 [Steroidobacteraceae bacterium]|nr:hypothetical protein [Steroidobacteraceae bacterium]
MRHSTRAFEWLAVVFALAWAAAAPAATAAKPALTPVEVSVHFPGEARTAAIVYARDLATGTITTARAAAGTSKLILKLAPGRYWLFAEPDDPGVPDLLGARTDWTVCRAAAPSADASACLSHGLVEIAVERSPIAGLTIDDWDLPGRVARDLDQALNRNPDRPDDLELGAPRFSEYPARVLAPVTPFQFDPGSHPEGAQWEAAVRAAAVQGVNFAGHWLVVANSCGDHCASFALIEWPTGRIFVPDALRAVSSTLPCNRAQPVQHRADSRLLTVTQSDDRSVVTRYFLWDESRGSLTEIASYRGSAERFCERD